MTPQAILIDLLESGIEPSVTADGQGIAVPAGRVTPAQRAAILANKNELIEYLIEASRITSRVLTAAMRRCDEWNDSPVAREQMRQDVLATPAHLRQDLLDHFNQVTQSKAQP